MLVICGSFSPITLFLPSFISFLFLICLSGSFIFLSLPNCKYLIVHCFLFGLPKPKPLSKDTWTISSLFFPLSPLLHLFLDYSNNVCSMWPNIVWELGWVCNVLHFSFSVLFFSIDSEQWVGLGQFHAVLFRKLDITFPECQDLTWWVGCLFSCFMGISEPLIVKTRGWWWTSLVVCWFGCMRTCGVLWNLQFWIMSWSVNSLRCTQGVEWIDC